MPWSVAHGFQVLEPGSELRVVLDTNLWVSALLFERGSLALSETWVTPMAAAEQQVLIPSAIDLTTMADAHHQDHQAAALPFVDHAVMAHP